MSSDTTSGSATSLPIRLVSPTSAMCSATRPSTTARRSRPTTPAATTAAGRDDHVSFYAASHPWEDFAESWAQVMHVHDVVSTGSAWGVVGAPGPTFDPEQWVSTAVLATLAANELARALGMRDLYPFALSPGARRKIEVAWRLTRGNGSA